MEEEVVVQLCVWKLNHKNKDRHAQSAIVIYGMIVKHYTVVHT